MEQLNRIELKGNVGSVKFIETATGRMARFHFATNYLYRDRDGNAGVETTWIPVVAFEGRNIPDVGKITKGAYLHVTGRVRNSRWTGADGTERQGLEVVARSIETLDDDFDGDNGMEGRTWD